MRFRICVVLVFLLSAAHQFSVACGGTVYACGSGDFGDTYLQATVNCPYGTKTTVVDVCSSDYCGRYEQATATGTMRINMT